ncbi:DUF134 domain-containing protein [Patescibacteria group bacterium]|nr:DUF134 domain-containing protein [Patescibacteria group bacterium]
MVNIRKRRGAGRPRGRRKIAIDPIVTYFKPRGLPLATLKEIDISKEELEALRLKNIKNLDQIQCAKAMKTSQSTFQRILSSAYKKISQAIVEGYAIKITKE